MRKHFLHILFVHILCFGITLAQGDGKKSRSPDKRFETGVQYFQSERYSDAVGVFLSLIAIKPVHEHTTASYLMAAKSYLREGNYDKSVSILNKFLDSYPASKYRSNAYLTLGVSYLMDRKNGEAAVAFFRSKSIVSDSLSASRADQLLQFLADGNISPEDVRKFPSGETEQRTGEYLTFLMAKRLFDKGEFEGARVLADSIIASNTTVNITNEALALKAKIGKGMKLKVGVLLPLFRNDSAPEKMFAEEMLDGINFALEENTASLPEGLKIELDIRDAARDNELAKSMLRELAAEQNLVGVIGPMFSSTAFDCAPIANEAKLPLLSPTANGRGIADKNPYMFQLNPDLLRHGKALARYAVKTLGLKTFAIIAPADSTVKTLVEEFYTEAIRDGATVATVEIYSDASDDLDEHFLKMRKVGLGGAPQIVFNAKMGKSQLDNLRRLGAKQSTLDSLKKYKGSINVLKLLGPYGCAMADSLGIPVTYPTVNARNLNAAMDMIDGLFLPITDADNITTILSQFAYYNIKTQLLGSAEWNNFNVLESNKPSAKGIIFCSDTYVDKGSARIKQFGEKYFAEMRKSPTRYSMFGYDTMDLLMHIIADGNTTREQVENALMKMPVFHGLHSTLTMGPERVNNTLNILQYKEGGIKKLGEVAVH